MVLLKSLKIEMGKTATDFSLMGTDGKKYSLSDFVDSKALVLVFMCNHCPYVQAIWDRLTRLQEKFSDLQFVGINPNTANPEYTEETMSKMKEYYDKYSMNFPYLEDFDQSVARDYGAVCTPDIYVYDSERKLVYHGRIDDNWQDDSAVEKEELSEVLQALIDESELPKEQNPCIGCSIKWIE